MTRPLAPRSLPASTMTVSPFFTFIDGVFFFGVLLSAMSEHLRGERDDPHEPLVAELPADGAEDARPAGVAAVADDDRGVLVEADVGTVRTTALLHRADDDGLDHVALLDPGSGQRVLHGADDDVADARVASPGTAEHPDAEDLLCSGVVGDSQPRLLLDHVPTPMPSKCSRGAAGVPVRPDSRQDGHGQSQRIPAPRAVRSMEDSRP